MTHFVNCSFLPLSPGMSKHLKFHIHTLFLHINDRKKNTINNKCKNFKNNYIFRSWPLGATFILVLTEFGDAQEMWRNSSAGRSNADDNQIFLSECMFYTSVCSGFDKNYNNKKMLYRPKCSTAKHIGSS